ncbi:MAG TPA: NFACT RNA binding domain-containing protein [Leptolyngbyaceae cyanobacterium]
MQPVDFTTLSAICHDLRVHWLPSRCEQVYQRDRNTICLALRTLDKRAWLTLSWHPQAARVHIGDAPPRTSDTFTLSQQIKHQINGLALVAIEPVAPWERAFDFQFARRPGDEPEWHLYLEVMGKYSNLFLTNARNQIVTVAHQVSEQQSSVRPVATGDIYELPPAIAGPLPNLQESQERWQERVSLIPGPLQKMLLKAYGGLSTALVRSLLVAADLSLESKTDTLSQPEWNRLFEVWQTWLQRLEASEFEPGWTETGYTVIGWGINRPAPNIQTLLRDYYTRELNLQVFGQLSNQLNQKLRNVLKKLRQKEATFQSRLEQSDQADQYRQQADLLMAYLHQWEPGMQSMTLADFETGEPITISLEPEKNAVQNAQALYKKHQKLKRARDAVAPLIADVRSEIAYLEQVEAALSQIAQYETEADLDAIAEIRDELIQQGYLEVPDYRSGTRPTDDINFYRAQTPGGLEVLVGRNNRQNDLLISRVAGDYDLWFHTQEIPGSHVLLRLSAGQVPSDEDLQAVANLAAFFSRARQADQVPVIYTEPRHVYKPKGARPGMVIYKHETVLWGQPQQVQLHPNGQDSRKPATV